MSVKYRVNILALLLRVVGITLSLIVIIYFLINVILMCITFKSDHYMFGELDECEKLASVCGDDAKFTRYENTDKDEHIFCAKYERFYAGKYDFTMFSLEIFAYEFSTLADAQRYYGNVLGNALDRVYSEDFTSGYSSLGKSGRTIVAFRETHAYLIHTSYIGEIMFDSKMDEAFSIKMVKNKPW